MSTLSVDTIQGQTAAANVKFPADNVVQVIKTDDFSIETSTYANITGLAATITPKYNTSKILITASFPDTFVTSSAAANSLYLKCVRNVGGGSFSDVCLMADRQGLTTPNSIEFMCSMSFSFLDSPTTTSACVYKCQLKSYNSNQVNVGQQSSGLVNIIAMEIAQ